ncbi:MAG: AI-2E family transporter, partial [Lachnospira sp.]|nr:AI-2E family transporter [Lachnospira sp.]
LFMSFIIAIYMLLYKKKLGAQTRKVLYAYCNEKVADKLCHVGQLINDSYAKFLSGQFIEAFIIAILLFIAFTIFRLPYAALIAVLAAVLSFIPYIGSLSACVIGAILILFISPWQAILSVVVFQVVQFLEGQFIYPHVVGNSVGLPAFYTLLAALLGGSLFGIVGIIFFIPFFAVIYTLVKESSAARLAKKGIQHEKIDNPVESLNKSDISTDEQ